MASLRGFGLNRAKRVLRMQILQKVSRELLKIYP